MRLALSLAIMLPWPLLGIVMTARWFDSWSEALLFFVGLSLIPGLVLAVLGVPDAVLFTGLTLIWIFVWIAPAAAPRRFDRGSGFRVQVLGVQAGFALLQAAVGGLMVLGKSV